MNRIRLFLLLFTLLFILLTPVYADEVKYTCPMHPHYISDTQGGCPICGMDLVEIRMDSSSDSNMEENKGLQLSQRLIQTTGLRRAVVETANYGRSIRSFGEVVANKRLQTDVSLRVEGWVDKLIVSAPGDTVKRGDILFYLYSPDLISAQQDYLLALQQQGKERALITRNRLLFLGLSQRVIKRITEKRELMRTVPYYAERAGQIENLSVRQGGYLRPGDVPIQIQNYSSVWVDVSLAEQDISYINKNSQVKVDFPNLGLHKEGLLIDYISPTVDQKTRTAKLRLLIDNDNGNIRPGAYADVTISVDIRPRLSIPYESVLQNKQGTYVIVEEMGYYFKARKVILGVVDKGRAEVQLGLKEGEVVVSSGQFLIDSESSLRESFQKMQKMSASLSQMAMSKEQMVLINHVLESGLYIHEQLIAGNLPSVEIVQVGAQAASKLLVDIDGTRLGYLVKDAEQLLLTADKVITQTGWQKILSQLIEILEPWLVDGRPGYYKDLGLALFTTQSGDRWLQFAGSGNNPYADDVFSEIELKTDESGGIQDGQ